MPVIINGTANHNKCTAVKGWCEYARLVATIDYSSKVLYERCTPKRTSNTLKKLG